MTKENDQINNLLGSLQHVLEEQKINEEKLKTSESIKRYRELYSFLEQIKGRFKFNLTLNLSMWVSPDGKNCLLDVTGDTVTLDADRTETNYSWESLDEKEIESFPAEFVCENKTLIESKQIGRGSRINFGGLPRDLLNLNCPIINMEELINKLKELVDKAKTDSERSTQKLMNHFNS